MRNPIVTNLLKGVKTHCIPYITTDWTSSASPQPWPQCPVDPVQSCLLILDLCHWIATGHDIFFLLR